MILHAKVADIGARLEDFQAGICSIDQYMIAALANPFNPSCKSTLTANEPLGQPLLLPGPGVDERML